MGDFQIRIVHLEAMMPLLARKTKTGPSTGVDWTVGPRERGDNVYALRLRDGATEDAGDILLRTIGNMQALSQASECQASDIMLQARDELRMKRVWATDIVGWVFCFRIV